MVNRGPVAQGDGTQPGEVLAINQPIASSDGRYTFIYQTDGNLVLYRDWARPTVEALWSSATIGKLGGLCVMQSDGNLVVYDPGKHPLWASDTQGNPGSRLLVQGDGNVVIYRPDGTPAWATNTAQA
jgi:hypothetical protein